MSSNDYVHKFYKVGGDRFLHKSLMYETELTILLDAQQFTIFRKKRVAHRCETSWASGGVQ